VAKERDMTAMIEMDAAVAVVVVVVEGEEKIEYERH